MEILFISSPSILQSALINAFPTPTHLEASFHEYLPLFHAPIHGWVSNTDLCHSEADTGTFFSSYFLCPGNGDLPMLRSHSTMAKPLEIEVWSNQENSTAFSIVVGGAAREKTNVCVLILQEIKLKPQTPQEFVLGKRVGQLQYNPGRNHSLFLALLLSWCQDEPQRLKWRNGTTACWALLICCWMLTLTGVEIWNVPVCNVSQFRKSLLCFSLPLCFLSSHSHRFGACSCQALSWLRAKQKLSTLTFCNIFSISKEKKSSWKGKRTCSYKRPWAFQDRMNKNVIIRGEMKYKRELEKPPVQMGVEWLSPAPGLAGGWKGSLQEPHVGSSGQRSVRKSLPSLFLKGLCTQPWRTGHAQ